MKYMGSKNRIAKHILPIMLKYRKPDQYWVEPFCLDENTNLYGEKGIVKISDVKVGDYIYDNNLILKRVVNKVKSSKTKGVTFITKGGVSITSTHDHVFYTENDHAVKADNLNIGMTLNTGTCLNNSDDILYIDMLDFITISNKKGGRSGKLLDGDMVKLYHNAPAIPRYIEITEDLMWCYGLVVAEGCKSSITLHKDEKDIAERFITIYSKTLGLDFRNNKIYTVNDRKNSISVAIPLKAIYEKIFFKAMSVGYGARNKNIIFLFDKNKDLFLSALRGMHLGDGCVVKRGKYRSWNYKTSSEILAKQIQTLLSVKLNIKSTFSEGVNKKRLIEGRVLEPSDYCNISVGRDEDVTYLTTFENPDIKIKEKSKRFIIKDIVSAYDKTFYDITLERGSTHKFILDGGIVTHNCGGGNMIDKVGGKRIGADLHSHLIKALILIRDLPNSIPDVITEEMYAECKEQKNLDGLTGFIGFAMSFGGKWFGGYRRDVAGTKGCLDNMTTQTRRSKNSAIKQSPNLQGVELINLPYLDLDIPENSIIYCDPPYANTTKYKGGFDHDEFWGWVRLKVLEGHTVFISEYTAPDDFKSIWSKEIVSSLTKDTGSKKGVEQLFVHESFVL